MENKNVGYLVLAISTLIVFIIFLFNRALNSFLDATCGVAGHNECLMFDTVTQQTYLSLAIVSVLIIIGLVLVFSKPNERVIVKKIKEKKQTKKIDTSDLRLEDKKVLKMVTDDKAVFQADLIEKTGFGKAKMTRIIDRLEGKDIVERKRRGMTNVVVLKTD